MNRIQTLQDIAIGDEYLFPRGKSYFAENACGFQYHSNSSPMLVRIEDIVQEDAYLTRIALRFLNSHMESGYNISICKNEFYDSLHRQFIKHDWFEVTHPERNIHKIFFPLTLEIRQKLDYYFQLKEQSEREIKTLEEQYRLQITELLKTFDDHEQYEEEINKFVKTIAVDADED